jgi:hypothetical protein
VSACLASAGLNFSFVNIIKKNHNPKITVHPTLKKESLDIAYNFAVMSTTEYSIDTPQSPRPYFNRLAFIAYDFQQWGYRISEHSSQSQYIREVKRRERDQKLAKSRPGLFEVWGQEVVRQPQIDQTPFIHSEAPGRLSRVSSMVQEFIRAIASQGASESPKRVSWDSPTCLQVKDTPLPTHPALNLVTVYMRLLVRVRHTQSVHLPDPQNTVVDRVDLEFHPHAWLGEHLHPALDKVRAVPGRWVTGPETVLTTGSIKVQMSVEVGDYVVPTRSRDERAVDPLPLYERVEQAPPYEPADVDDGVEDGVKDSVQSSVQQL